MASPPSASSGTFPALEAIENWMASLGHRAFDWQRQTWQAYWQGNHGLILASTGMGKTRAAWMGPLGQWLHDPLPESEWTRVARRAAAPPLQALWITPMRALANDTSQALQECIRGLDLPWTLEQRTGDTSAAAKVRQRTSPPTAMVITPESLTLMLSYPESQYAFRHLRSVIVDEWHELLGTKRGIQTELALARLSEIAPLHQRWGVSATIGNPQFSLASLVGSQPARSTCIIEGPRRKAIDLQLLVPASVERFPWAGHIGLAMLPQVIERIEGARSTLVFANTRNQTELWYQAMLKARPDWAGRIAVHHGSLSSDIRSWVEEAVRNDKLLAVVCTSSLDLGVDFSPVDQVIQIGSPKGVARLVQRAGRSGHRPDVPSRLIFVPSHALEIIELEAARQAIEAHRIEQRPGLDKPLDCLAQHSVTMSLAGRVTREGLLEQVRSTYAYRDLTDEEFDWVLEFVTTGGSLHAYENYHRVHRDAEGYRVVDPVIARQHRMAIGTITADLAMNVQYLKGGKIGTVEESFAARLKPGDRFLLGGKLLRMEWIRDGTVWVRRGQGSATAVPRWMGGRMPLSSELSEGVRNLLDAANCDPGQVSGLKSLADLLALQRRWSHVPNKDEVLIETIQNRDGHSLIIYPFEGRSVSEGLGALLAYRLSQHVGISFAIAVNDYGFMLHSPEPPPIPWHELCSWLSVEHLERDILASLNATEMTRRRFRDIARIAGLIHQGMPGRSKSARHLQASAGMVFDALREYDAENRLLWQASDEVLRDQLELHRLTAALSRMQQQRWIHKVLPRWSPFSFPLYVERIRDRISSESLADRIRKVQMQLEKVAVSELQDAH